MDPVATAGDKAAAGAHTNKATALLLPAALAHLEQLLAAAQRAKHAASRPQHAQHESARGNAASGQVHIEAGDGHTAQTDAVRLFYEKELMVYLTARSKSPQGDAFCDAAVCIDLFLVLTPDG